jgi:hypothetical protein
MLPQNLTTNEVKNASGTEVEFLRWRESERKIEFAKSGETPNAENRHLISHQDDIGTGINERRRSALISRYEFTGASGEKREVKITTTYDVPVGDMTTLANVNELAAQHGSLLYLDGTGTTFLFAGTGVAHSSLRDGSL